MDDTQHDYQLQLSGLALMQLAQAGYQDRFPIYLQSRTVWINPGPLARKLKKLTRDVDKWCAREISALDVNPEVVFRLCKDGRHFFCVNLAAGRGLKKSSLDGLARNLISVGWDESILLEAVSFGAI